MSKELNYENLAPCKAPVITPFAVEYTFRAIDGGRVVVSLEVRTDRSGKASCLALQASIYDKFAKQPHSGGQTYDYISELVPALAPLVPLWIEWHLNTCQVGTKAQLEALQGLENESYATKKTFLAHNALLTHDGFTYGHSWLIKELTEDAVSSVTNALLNANPFKITEIS